SDGSFDDAIFPFWFDGGDGKGGFHALSLAPPAWLSLDHDGWSAGPVPLYAGGRHGADYYDVVPPLLFARWGDDKNKNLWMATGWLTRDEGGWAAGPPPLSA